jgi:hypothetical protein
MMPAMRNLRRRKPVARRNPAKVTPLKRDKPVATIGKGVRLWAFGETIPDVATFLSHVLFVRHGVRGQIGNRVTAELYHPIFLGRGVPPEEDFIGSVGFDLDRSLSPALEGENVWYVPLNSMTPRGMWLRDPRYKSALDAIVVSLRQNNGERFYVGAFDAAGRRGEEIAGGSLEQWGNEEYLKDGAIQGWWLDQIAAIPVGPYWEWLGSDDSMSWGREPTRRRW